MLLICASCCSVQVLKAKAAGVVAFKLYPAGATTNSDSGVTDIGLVVPTLRAMAQVTRTLCRVAHCVLTAGVRGTKDTYSHHQLPTGKSDV